MQKKILYDIVEKEKMVYGIFMTKYIDFSHPLPPSQPPVLFSIFNPPLPPPYLSFLIKPPLAKHPAQREKVKF